MATTARSAFDQPHHPGDDAPYTVQEALDVFEFGLARVPDGIEAYIASNSTS
jgi:hypothetical protein